MASSPAVESVEQAFATLGYPRQGFRSDLAGHLVPYDTPNLDLLIFTDPVRHDLDTTAAVVLRARPTNSLWDRLLNFGAPIVILVHPGDTHDTRESEQVSVYSLHVGRPPEVLLERATPENLKRFLTSQADKFAPSAIQRAKTLAFQLTLAEVDPYLATFAAEATDRWLFEVFEESRTAAGVFGDLKVDTTEAILTVLAARTLEDKVLGRRHKMALRELLVWAEETAAIRAPGLTWASQFRDVLSAANKSDSFAFALEAAHVVLTGRLSLTLFTERALSLLFERAHKDNQRAEGAYATPHSLAQQIWQRIPIELLPPQRRIILDPACGCGNLLLNGFRRLRSVEGGLASEHLLDSLIAVEQNPFTFRLLEISVLVAALWEKGTPALLQGDFLDKAAEAFAKTPGIVIANPPFGGGRKKVYFERAAAFLTQCFRRLESGGLLVFILPRSLATTRVGKSIWTNLLRESDVFELWDLPARVFSSEVETMVLFLRKAQRAVHPVQIRWLAPGAMHRHMFLEVGQWSAEWSLPGVSHWQETGRISIDPLTPKFMGWTERLSSIAQVRNGITVSGGILANPGGEASLQIPIPMIKRRRDVFALTEGPDVYYDAASAKDAAWAPLHTAKSLMVHKILVGANRTPGSPWRIPAFEDRLGLAPDHAFHAVIPYSEEDFNYILCLLNSELINAWLADAVATRWIPVDAVASIPLPPNPEPLRHQAGSIVALARNRRFHEAYSVLEDAVVSAYRLSEDDMGIIRKRTVHSRRPGLVTVPTKQIARPQEQDSGEEAVGEVVEVDKAAGTVSVHLAGITVPPDLTQVPLTPALPGWLLRAGVLFTARVHSNETGSVLTDVQPHPYAYADMSALMDRIEQASAPHAEMAKRIGVMYDDGSNR